MEGQSEEHRPPEWTVWPPWRQIQALPAKRMAMCFILNSGQSQSLGRLYDAARACLY